MELNNEFRVAVPAAKTWQVLTDVERVAPCIPGAQLLSVDGDDFTGAVKVKVGPITVSYKGDASFQEKDEAAQRVGQPRRLGQRPRQWVRGVRPAVS